MSEFPNLEALADGRIEGSARVREYPLLRTEAVQVISKMGRMFPILDGPAIPWFLIAPYEAQAQRNHSQTLERLAERGGLGCAEAIDVMTNQRWSTTAVRGSAQKLHDLVQERLDTRTKAVIERLRKAVEKHGEDCDICGQSLADAMCHRCYGKLESRNTELGERVRFLENRLMRIAQGRGRYSTDPAEHCANTVDDMKQECINAVLGIED
jgi:hypothetical protein